MSLANVSDNKSYHLWKAGHYNRLSWHHWRRQHFWRSNIYYWLANHHSRKAKSGFMLG